MTNLLLDPAATILAAATARHPTNIVLRCVIVWDPLPSQGMEVIDYYDGA